MNSKKQSLQCLIGLLLKKTTSFLGFITILFLFFCFPVEAEQEDEKEPEPMSGGVILKEYPTELYKVPEGITAFSDLPDSINLSAQKYFPPIRDQGKENSCAAWSQVYYQFTYEVARLNNYDAKYDDSKVFSPRYVWNYLNEGYNKGLEMHECYDFLEKQGALRWSEFPQKELSFDWYKGASEEATTAVLRNALKIRISKVGRNTFANLEQDTPITGNKDLDLMYMKQTLNEGHVLSVATECKMSGTENKRVLSNGEWGIITGELNKNEQGSREGHALTIVGYDDNIYYDINGNGSIESFEQGAFLIANSWGTNAAGHNNGFIWVMYDALNKQSNFADLNIDNRERFFWGNICWYIEVENYNPQRMVEVTIEQKYRNDITIKLARSNSSTSHKVRNVTFLNQIGGTKSFDGGNNGYQTCTFVFDYDTLYNGEDKVYWVEVIDNAVGNGAYTTVKKIRWIDSAGKIVKTLGQQSSIDGNVKLYECDIMVNSITLNKTSSSLYIGESERLTATVKPDNAKNKGITWKSSNPSVVYVDKDTGIVTCAGTGTATVTATATDGSGVSASCIYRITDDYPDVFGKAFGVSLHGKIQGAINRSGDIDYFKFTPTVTGNYLIYTTGSMNTVGYLYDSSQKLLLQNNSANLYGNNFALQYRLEAGRTYYIRVNGYSTTTGNYTLNIARDFYSASLASLNQDARRVQMQAEASSTLTKLEVIIGGKTYVLNRPASGNLDTTVNGARFKVTFVSNNGGLSTIWKIEADIPATTASGGETVTFRFSKGDIKANSPGITGFIAYSSAVKTGVDTSAANSLQKLLTTMQQINNTLTVRNGDNTLVNVTSATKAATGMKIIETDKNGWILKIHYLVVFGDVTGGTKGNVGNGQIDSDDALIILKAAVDASKLGGELARLAADVDHDGNVTTDDALLTNKQGVGNASINQNYTITDVPDECYYLDPVTF